MRSLIKTITALLLSAAVLFSFAACGSDKPDENSGSTDSNVSESSESKGEKRSELLLYKVRNDIDKEYEWTEIYDYNEFGEISVKTTCDVFGTSVTKYEYNDNKQLISATTTDSSGKVSTKYEYEHNDSGLLVKEKRTEAGEKRETTYSYDENNRLICIDSGVIKRSYTYNEDGSYKISWINMIGDAMQELYNQKGLITESSSSDGTKTVYSYNEKGDILTAEYYDIFGDISYKEVYEYNGQITVYREYNHDELTRNKREYYDEQNNLIKVTIDDEQGNEEVVQELEYKLFDVVR